MSQKEQLAKLASRLIQDPDYTFAEAVEAAFLLGAKARTEQLKEHASGLVRAAIAALETHVKIEDLL